MHNLTRSIFIRSILTLFLILATATSAIAQDYALDSLTRGENPIAIDISLFGVMADYHSKRPVKSGKVTISNEKNEVRMIPVDSVGGWIDLLPCDHLYKIQFTAPGYVTKHIVIDARSIPLEDQLGGFSMDVDITLFKAIDGVDYEILEKPVGISRYDPYTYSIAWDPNQVGRMQDKLKKLMKAYDKHWKELAKRKK